jgi:hypothetical protein
MATPAPACLKALQDATGRWPQRNSAGDGIMGDASHQQRKSDHNDGNAFDLTHDPAHGVDCTNLSRQVILDSRVTYVIWNRQIFNRQRAAEGWRPYDGPNPHDHHMHVSISASARNDVSKWPWSGVAGFVKFGGHPLKEGSAGPDVMAMQKRLVELGYGIKVDGQFGAKTRQAVVRFQQDAKLNPDGVIGRIGWAVLMAGGDTRASVPNSLSL